MIGTLQLVTSLCFAVNLELNLRRRKRLWLRFDELESGVIKGWTLAIPVRNEEENLRRLLKELGQQRYLPERLLFLDDQSEDASREVLQQMASSLTGTQVDWIPGKSLPDGWRGKIWALQQLLEQVTTPYVFFMDADVSLLHPNALKALALDVCPAVEKGEVSFSSVFPRPEVDRSTALVVDQLLMHLYYFLPFFWEQMRSASAVAGCGQLMATRVDRLRSSRFLEELSASTHDGLKLARKFKAQGAKVTFFDGTSGFSCRYYADFPSAFSGLVRNTWEADGHVVISILVASLFFWNFVLPFVLLPLLIWNPAFLAAFLAILWSQWRLAEELKLKWDHPVMSPVKAATAVGVHLWSPLKRSLGLEHTWRGRKV